MIPAALESTQQIKARGAFYTPEELTHFLGRWAVRSPDDRVLEPACGEGAFIAALSQRFSELGRSGLNRHLLAIERQSREASKSRLVAPDADIRTLDFFDLDPQAVEPVDAAVGNPPYIRYHGFNGEDRVKALARAREQGVELTRLASSWAHFVVHASGFLKPSGRLALVLPAELFHTDYGRPVREFLLRRFSSVVVIAFDRLVFPDAQVDAVLLLASQDDSSGLRVIRVKDERSLETLNIAVGGLTMNSHSPSRWSASVDTAAGAVYTEAIERYDGRRLGDLASVDIGFVSGANDFFVLSHSQADSLGLPGHLLTPAIRRPSDVRGIEVRPDEVSWLLNLAGQGQLGPSVLTYLSRGESTGISQRYKCRVRTPWYAVPLPKRRADAFLPYMFHLGPRLVVNRVGARSTNLLHGVSLKEGAPPAAALAVAMASSLTLLSAEVEGRAYGGGVLKLETREAERLLVPDITGLVADRLPAIFHSTDELIRTGDIRSAARSVDEIFGLDHDWLWGAYMAFRDRRLGRRRASRTVMDAADRRA